MDLSCVGLCWIRISIRMSAVGVLVSLIPPLALYYYSSEVYIFGIIDACRSVSKHLPTNTHHSIISILQNMVHCWSDCQYDGRCC